MQDHRMTEMDTVRQFFSNPRFMKGVEKARKECKEGKCKSFEDFKTFKKYMKSKTQGQEKT